jgi:hypothetical protein
MSQNRPPGLEAAGGIGQATKLCGSLKLKFPDCGALLAIWLAMTSLPTIWFKSAC